MLSTGRSSWASESGDSNLPPHVIGILHNMVGNAGNQTCGLFWKLPDAPGSHSSHVLCLLVVLGELAGTALVDDGGSGQWELKSVQVRGSARDDALPRAEATTP